jgi:hypothetical protein
VLAEYRGVLGDLVRFAIALGVESRWLGPVAWSCVENAMACHGPMMIHGERGSRASDASLLVAAVSPSGARNAAAVAIGRGKRSGCGMVLRCRRVACQ